MNTFHNIVYMINSICNEESRAEFTAKYCAWDSPGDNYSFKLFDTLVEQGAIVDKTYFIEKMRVLKEGENENEHEHQ